MQQINHLRARFLFAAVAALGLGTLSASAATQQYFDVNGTASGYGITNGATYTWESAYWATASGGAAATSNFVNDGTAFPRFYGGSTGNSYTVTMASEMQTVGMYVSVTGGITVNLTPAPSSSGSISIQTSGAVVPLTEATGGTLQGFFITGTNSNLVINAPVTGPGGIEQKNSGAISLFGNNTYAGGTETTGGQNLYYNNNNSFGTGAIYFKGTGAQGIINSGPAGVTIANPVVWGTAGGATNFASGAGTVAAPGAIWSGGMTLPATGTVSMLTGSAAQVTKISGIIGGASGVNIAPGGTAPNNGGTMIFSGANTYTGATTVTGPSKLVLAATDTIATTSSLILAGGTLDPNGFDQAMAGTLGLTAASTIDFGAGAVELDFANSAAETWAGTLNLVNWDPAVTKVRFGTDSSGLTSDQLADIQVNGAAAPLFLDGGGYLAVPEPASLSLLGIGAAGLLARRRRA